MKTVPPKFITENEHWDKKSLKFFGANPKWNDLFEDIVAFANNKGGNIYFGIEDNESLPPAEQKLSGEWANEWFPKIRKKISENTENVNPVVCSREIAENGGEYIKMQIFATQTTLACTNKGVYTIRFEDSTQKLKPNELQHILNEKGAYIWESRKTVFLFSESDDESYSTLLRMIRTNEKLEEFIKEKTDREILVYFKLIEGECLTNLGVLWIGTMHMRAKIAYPLRLSVMYLDEFGSPMRPQKDFTDLMLSPQSVLERVMSLEIWQEGIEISDGLYREFVEFYPREAVKELVANAICHRSYTLDGDILIKVYAGTKLEIISPGSLPYGVTPSNILHVSKPRNQQFAELAKATKMMEKVGSGYDKVYEKLLSKGKNIPLVETGDDWVRVTIQRTFSDPGIVNLMNEVSKRYQPNQKELIVFGFITQHGGLTSIELARYLSIEPREVKIWLGTLPEKEIIIQKGETKGTLYLANPKLLKILNHTVKTTLKYIEPYRLEALILSDLDAYGLSGICDIRKRIGGEIQQHTVRRMLEKLILQNRVQSLGSKRWKKYMSLRIT